LEESHRTDPGDLPGQQMEGFKLETSTPRCGTTSLDDRAQHPTPYRRMAIYSRN
jgi:hypothetical protein